MVVGSKPPSLKNILQVAWDEPDLLQNVKQVSPWLVELVSNMPAIHLSPFSPPRKKLRVPQPSDFPFIGQYPMPSFPSSLLRPNNPFCCVPDNIPAGIQGARHAHFGLSSADLHFKKLQPGSFPQSPSRVPTEDNDSLSSLLTMGVSTQHLKKNNEIKAPMFLLFGQPIHTKEQISESSSDGNQEKTTYFSDGSGSGVVQNGPAENSSDDGSPWYKDNQKSDFGLEMGQCKVFMESEDVGRTLDLTALGSYEELYRKLANMFNVERSEMLSNVLYQDTSGAVKHTEDEPFR